MLYSVSSRNWLPTNFMSHTDKQSHRFREPQAVILWKHVFWNLWTLKCVFPSQKFRLQYFPVLKIEENKKLPFSVAFFSYSRTREFLLWFVYFSQKWQQKCRRFSVKITSNPTFWNCNFVKSQGSTGNQNEMYFFVLKTKFLRMFFSLQNTKKIAK